MPARQQFGGNFFWLCPNLVSVKLSKRIRVIQEKLKPHERDRFMNLDESQRKKVTEWIGQGLKLSEIQGRLGSELGLTMTYMEVRLLVDDLKLTPKDIERPKTPQTGLASPPAPSNPPSPAAASKPIAETSTTEPAPAGGGVSVTVDHLARPGALVSGKVTFSDGNRADWYLDQTGRLGLSPQLPGYRPPPADVQQFQSALESELSKMGL